MNKRKPGDIYLVCSSYQADYNGLIGRQGWSYTSDHAIQLPYQYPPYHDR